MSDSVIFGAESFAGAVLVIMVVLIAALMFHRRKKEIKASSPFFCFLVVLGGMVMNASIFVGSYNDDLGCHASYWCLTVGFTILYGSLVIKNWRILKIFNSKSLQMLKLSNASLLLRLSILIGIDLALLMPLYALSDTCALPDALIPLVLCIALLVYKFALVVFGMVVAWKSKVINIPEFNERIQLGYATYNLSFSLLVLLPIVLLFRDFPTPVFIIRSVGVAFVTLITMGFLFAPKFYRVCCSKKRPDRKQRMPLNDLTSTKSSSKA